MLDSFIKEHNYYNQLESVLRCPKHLQSLLTSLEFFWKYALSFSAFKVITGAKQSKLFVTHSVTNPTGKNMENKKNNIFAITEDVKL